MSPKPRESKARPTVAAGEPGRVFPIAWGGRVRSAYAGGASWGGPLLPGSTAELAPYLAARASP